MRQPLRHLIGMLAVVLAVTTAHADTIRFGAILPLTGPGAMIGTQQMRGIQFAIDKANAAGGVHGNKMEVLFEDNQAKPDQSILSFNKLADLQHVPMIFTAYSGPSLAMAPLATRKKILLINAGAQADKLATASPYLVNTLPTIGDEVKVISKYLIGEGKKQGAILFENDAAGIAGRDDFVKFFPEAGGTILSQEPTQFGQTDYRPALLKLADAKPEVMLVSITAGLLQMAQQYRQLGLQVHRRRHDLLLRPGHHRRPCFGGFCPYPGPYRRATGTGGRIQGEIRRRNGVLRPTGTTMPRRSF